MPSPAYGKGKKKKLHSVRTGKSSVWQSTKYKYWTKQHTALNACTKNHHFTEFHSWNLSNTQKEGNNCFGKAWPGPSGEWERRYTKPCFYYSPAHPDNAVLGKGDLYGHLNQRTMRQGDFPNSSVFSSGGGRFFSISRMKLPPSSVRVKSRGKYWHINHSGTWERELLRKESGLDRGWKKAANGDKRPQGSLTPQADLMLLGKPF